MTTGFSLADTFEFTDTPYLLNWEYTPIAPLDGNEVFKIHKTFLLKI